MEKEQRRARWKRKKQSKQRSRYRNFKRNQKENYFLDTDENFCYDNKISSEGMEEG